ncbi:MAG: hypothetical protein ACRDT6_05400 [Micromonosporaceae bacterium]
MAVALTPASPVSADVRAAAADAVVDIPDVAPPTIGDPVSEAELQDLQTLADQSGMSLDAAIDRYAWNDNFALAVAEIREAHPEAFTMAEIVGGRARVAFAGEVPDDAREIIAGFSRAHRGVSVDVQRGWGYTELSLERAVEDVHYAVLASPAVGDAVTSFDSATGEITTAVVLKSGHATAALGALREVAGKRLATSADRAVAARITATVVASKHSALGGDDSSSYHHGGEYLSGCTSGFGTKTSGGTRGISTAGHCGNSQSDDGYSLTYKAGYRGTHGDFQWHTGPKTETDDFYSGSSTSTEVNKRDVSARGAPVTGQSLCKNGKNGKKDCQEVRKLGVCSNDDCNLVQMGARLAEPGDSGGPVFWGNTAYGLHKGWHYDPFWPYDRDLFSRADRMDNALNTYVATS